MAYSLWPEQRESCLFLQHAIGHKPDVICSSIFGRSERPAGIDGLRRHSDNNKSVHRHDPISLPQSCDWFAVTMSPSWTGPHASSSRNGNTCAQISFNKATSNGFKT